MDNILVTTLYRNFNESISSEVTKRQYQFYLQKYIKHIGGEENLLRDGLNNVKLIESQIIDYILTLKAKNDSYSYLSGNLTAVYHFYTMNDILLNKKKINRFIGTKKLKKYKDKGYNTDQIAKILEFCDDRTRLMILLYASTGMRLSGLLALKIRDLERVAAAAGRIYRITVYEGFAEEYVTFCTPECAKVIDSYLAHRERCGERLRPDSPLIREQFNKEDSLRLQNARHIRKSTLIEMIANKLRQAGLRDREHGTEDKYISQIRKSIPLIHGFRKFFNTALMNADVHPSFKELLMGHSIKLDDVYYDKNSDKSKAKLLDEYSKAIDYLTINEENRLRIKVEQLTVEKSQMDKLESQINELRQLIK